MGVAVGTWGQVHSLAAATCRRFFKSPHFDGWYRQRHREMAHKLEALHLEALCEAVRMVWVGEPELVGAQMSDGRTLCPWQDLETWMKDKSEVEVVDLVLKLREKLVRPGPALPCLPLGTPT